MPRISFIQSDGNVRDVDVAEGDSLMEAAVRAGVAGIDADCGGAGACATCHVHVDAAWLDRMPAMAALERELLDYVEDADGSSRLSCQVRADAALEGLVVRVPKFQFRQ